MSAIDAAIVYLRAQADATQDGGRRAELIEAIASARAEHEGLKRRVADLTRAYANALAMNGRER